MAYSNHRELECSDVTRSMCSAYREREAGGESKKTGKERNCRRAEEERFKRKRVQREGKRSRH